MTETDYYKILGVEQNAQKRQIKDAYRKLAFKYHPDRHRDNPQAAEKMKRVNEAYAVLSNPAKRSEYDALKRRFGDSATNQFRQNYSEQDIFSGSDINQIFEQVARAFGVRGFDEIFKEFYGQGSQSYTFKKPGVFARGFVFRTPPGGDARGQAHPVRQGALEKFSRFLLKKISGIELPEDGADINDVIYISPEQAQHGGPYAYLQRKTSKKLIVKIPPGIRHGQRIRLAGMGAPGKGGGSAGDLLLQVNIRKPLLRSIKNFLAGRRKSSGH